MDPEEWKRFVMKIDVSAPMESVYAAWTTAEGLMGWIGYEVSIKSGEGEELEPGGAAKVGDHLRSTWPTGHTEEGEYLVEPAIQPMVMKIIVPAVSFIGRTYKKAGMDRNSKTPKRVVEYWTSFEDAGRSPAGSRIPRGFPLRDHG